MNQLQKAATDIQEQTNATVQGSAPTKSWYKHYTLVILTLVYASSYMDRQITSILVEDLKHEFLLSDMQLGLLSGLAFALFYATLGIPIARLADRYNRVNIITIAVTIWSAMTALSGAAMSFGQLLMARIGVGVGEAGASPPSHSIISDYYSSKQRPMALSVWAMGTVFGALAGLVLGGYIAEAYGWRMAFVAAGVPGLVLALLLKFTITEPVRGQSETAHSGTERAPEQHQKFKVAAMALWHNRRYRFATLAHVIAVFYGYSISWLPALFIRQYGLSQSEVGVIIGLTIFIAGIGGLLVGGYLASRLSRNNPAWESWVPGLALLVAAPIFVLGLHSATATMAALLFGLAFFFYQFSHGPGLSLVQSSVESNKRAFASAVMYFASNMLGLGLGPVIVGYISDLQLGETAGESLAYGLYLGVIALVLSSMTYWYLGYLWKEQPGSKKPT